MTFCKFHRTVAVQRLFLEISILSSELEDGALPLQNNG